MANTYATCLAFTLSQEGGWENDPRDRGGCTMKGITLPVYARWKRNAHLTCNDLHNVTDDEVSEFYADMYWMPILGNDLPLGVDLMVFDAAVNIGISRSVKMLQSLVGAVPDGSMGPATIAATLLRDATALVTGLSHAQMAFYLSLADFDIYGSGWSRRVTERQNAATSMMSIS